ncbi:uncharacterized protein LOC133364435 isoform X1 [Rhineura floridana]|uniref:uncharacterized protein LOC133364435 isoform X1 n=1 Tax=Rhineura floridana TaxID=261503 RepID=UPI002AC89343|nr:uncharacterized protein LOC133364435 isoform X1 [Rhineura floridana]XP_061440924.1 uncharacterized protein LOC133364435 isoform X1 [Rhineura floridana]XP_061440925.1 uncharacterized protein LOC133364435 isoform X1 [Rhineura floridana]XP_061440926.1 uncharacterized protein LOC133364435 isoform X1 [Rhineura floridana]XP_061440928.1 uncharacterized protein LOC133364435 isoform X1 [Rhineura floridana]XP_061440929.1 uncharacterized protein LOC133364435 isoform X1 [Rhineura floridana]
MDRYRYFIFNQKSMVLLGLFQIACATICIISGLIDGAFRRESALSKSRIPIWAGMFMSIPGVMALFSSQKKNPVLVNAMIIASVFSCFTTLIVIVYASITLEYGEKYEGFNDLPSNHPAFAFVLDKLVEGANITILIVSIFSAFIVLIIAYVSCRSLPCCSCYDSVTGLEWLQSNEDQLQTAELVCISPGQADRIFNSPEKLPDLKMEADDEMTKPPPYIRLT